MFPAKLDGTRINLREWRKDEVDALHRWIGNPDVMRFLSWGSANKAETASYLKEILGAQLEIPRTKYFLAVEDKRLGGTIGDAGFTWIEPNLAEIGYFLEPEYWGMGYGVEAARLVMRLAFQLGADEVQATCFAENRRSERVMQSCGMKLVVQDNPRVRRYCLPKPGSFAENSAM